ncbi:MAG TPA: SDR family NAD(P)-dependent oxidoreductase, partial [Pseudomonadales bacterium]|nr:SDR family NAD(P)-dependent oxidoreductase [Pseudomonadales bacterium]
MGHWTPANMPNLSDKVAIVTGANSGLGFQTTLELARHGAKVILACRDQGKTQAAMHSIQLQVPNAKLEFMKLDLADLDSVAAFADAFKQKYKQLDFLFNNAGVMALPETRTRQGFEMQFGTNHLGHFALTGHLLPTLLATPGARIINTASLAHDMARRGLSFDDLNWQRRTYHKWGAYGASKLSNLLFTYEMNRRLQK